MSGPSAIDGPVRPGAVETTESTEAADPSASADAASASQNASAAHATNAASATQNAHAAADVEQMAAAIESGTLTRSQAIEQLIESALSAEADPARREELATLIRDTLETDPHLSALVRSLAP